jgi:DMSO/TMAO reductase YedYZ molybdopterin-dependent catalytic subunit
MSSRPRDPRLPPNQHATRGWPVLHIGTPPLLDASNWRLRVHGHVEQPFELDAAELARLPRAEVACDWHCVTGWSILGSRWSGVLMLLVARKAVLKAGCSHVRFADPTGYDTSAPLEHALSPESLLATHKDGEPIPAIHGGPVRGFVPSLYAWKSCKWLTEIEFMAGDRLGYWEQRGYHNGADPWREERLV